MSFIDTRAAIVLAASLSIAPPALGDAVITPTDVTVGTIVTVTGGAGFDGGKTPRVFGRVDDIGRRIAFKVLAYTDASLTLETRRIPNTEKDPAADKSWTLFVQPRGPAAGGHEPLPVGTIRSRAPRILSVAPTIAVPGDRIDVTVDFAGTKRLRARIGGKRVKIETSPQGPHTVVSFEVPKKVANGELDVTVTSRVGSGVAPASVLVIGGSGKVGKESLTATIDGLPYAANARRVAAQYGNGVTTILAVFGSGSHYRSILMNVPFDPHFHAPPATFTASPASIAFIETHLFHGGLTNTIWSANSGIDITIHSAGGDQIGGTFGGTLGGGDGTPVDVSGSFTVRVERL